MKWIGSESRQAWASVLSSAGSMAGPPDHGSRSVCERSASICRRSRGGISAITLDSACTDVSSMPGVPPAAEDWRLTAIATASSSSSSSGGSWPPARSW